MLTKFAGIPESTIIRIITKLSSEQFELVERRGARKDGGYVLTSKGTDFLMRQNNGDVVGRNFDER